MTDERLETGHGPDTPLGDTIQRRFLRSQVSMLHTYAGAADGRAFDDGELGGGTTGLAVPYLNQAVLLRPVLDAGDPLLDRAAQVLAGADSSLLSVWPTPDLAHRGWHLMGHPALVARAGGAATSAVAPGVEVVEVTTPEELAVAEKVAIEGYPLPGVESAFPPRVLDSDVRLRLGLLDGEPVGVAASHVSSGVVNLCLAATLPAARRRGVWQALVQARLDDAPDLPAVAFTSDFSRPGFEAMGFLVMSRCTLWFRPA